MGNPDSRYLRIFVRTGHLVRLGCSRLCRWLRILAVIGFVLITGSTHAIADQTLAQMYHTRWTVREGAPKFIYHLAQTTDGFLWLTTDDGLYRFDGQSFDHYHPTSGDPFPDNQMRAIAATADGGLWLGYGRSGVSFLKNGRNTNYGEKSGFGRASIARFAIGPDGLVWAHVGSESTLRVFDGTTWTTVAQDWHYPALSPANTIFMDADGTLWVGTQTGMLYRRRGEHEFRTVADVAWSVTWMAQTTDGTLWLGSADAATRALDPYSARIRQDISPIDLRAIYLVAQDGNQFLFHGPFDGLGRVQWPVGTKDLSVAIAEHMDHFSSRDGLTDGRIFAAIRDREGSTWVATAKGLDQFRPTPFTRIEAPPENNITYTAAAVAGAGQIYIGANLLDVATGRLLRRAPSTVFDILSIYRDPHDTLWFGGRSGLWKLSGDEFVAEPLPSGLPSPRPHPFGGPHIQAILQDQAGGLWVSIARHGLYRRFEGAWSKITNMRDAPDNLNTTMIEDSRGRIWFGFSKSNLIQMLDHGVVTTFDATNGIDIGYTTAICEIGGEVVIGGETGLAVLRKGTFRRLRLAGAAPLSAVTGMLQQKNGDVWIQQRSGVIKIDATEIKKVLLNPDLPMQFRLFNELDGVDEAAIPPAPLPTILDAGNGVLYFRTFASVFAMDTTRVARNSVAPTVIIRSLSTESTDYTNFTDAVLPPNAGRVTIRFGASSLLIPQRVQFRYRLDGIDEAWQSSNAERFAIYSRLPPGHYLFRVTSSNNDGVWSTQEGIVRFTISPSFTQTWSFKTLCAVGALFLLWQAYRIRTRQIVAAARRRLSERLEERTQIARNLHDTFFQSIQGLLMRFNTGTGLLRADEPARAILEQALEQSDRVMSEGRDLMLKLRAGSQDTREMAAALLVDGNELKDIYPGDFQVTVNGEPLRLHPVVFDEARRVGREALSNALRHAQATHIEVELHYERSQFRFRVRDDGIGIADEILARGFRADHWGLPGMRERATNVGGQLDIWSRPGAGTEIELRIPSAAAYAPQHKRTKLGWLRPKATRREDDND